MNKNKQLLRVFAIIAMVSLFASAVSCVSLKAAQSKGETQPEVSDLNKAVSIALAESIDARKSQGELKLVGAEQIVVKGKYIWRITLKPISLLPDDPSTQLIGAGGEIFVNVDLKTGEAIIGYGE